MSIVRRTAPPFALVLVALLAMLATDRPIPSHATTSPPTGNLSVCSGQNIGFADRFDYVTIAPDGSVAHIVYQIPAGGSGFWSPWEDLGGQVTSVSCAWADNGSIFSIAAVGTDGHIWTDTWGNGWTGWTSAPTLQQQTVARA